MTLQSRQEVILAKLEAVQYTDAAPTGVDAVLASNIKASPFNADTVKRSIRRLSFGSNQELHVGVHAGIEFDVEWVGSGTLGTAPAFGKLLKACQCQETLVALTSTAYTPNSAGTDTLTFHYYLDGQKHAIVGAQGSWSLKVSSQGIPTLSFKFIGLYVGPVSAANPTSLTGWDDFQAPLPVVFDETTGIEFHSYAAVLKELTVDQGNDVKFADDPGLQEIKNTNRESKGSFTILAPAISDKNYFSSIKTNTLGNVKVVHGTDTARRAIFEAAGLRAQLTKPSYGDDNGRATLTGSLIFVPTSAEDDEWELRFAAA